MTITIEASPELMEAITREAAREGLTPQEYALQAVSQKAEGRGIQADPASNTILSPMAAEEMQLAKIRADATARMGRLSELFAAWDKEDATDAPEELARRQKEGDELQANLRANRFNIPQDPALVALLAFMDG